MSKKTKEILGWSGIFLGVSLIVFSLVSVTTMGPDLLTTLVGPYVTQTPTTAVIGLIGAILVAVSSAYCLLLDQ